MSLQLNLRLSLGQAAANVIAITMARSWRVIAANDCRTIAPMRGDLTRANRA